MLLDTCGPSPILWTGGQAGRAFESDPVAGRPAGIRFQAITSVVIFVILVLMIWKPGA